MAPLSGFAKRKLKLQKEEQTKKLAGSLIRFIKPNTLVVSDTLPAVAVHTDAYNGKYLITELKKICFTRFIQCSIILF